MSFPRRGRMAQDTLHSAADIRKYFVIMTYVKGRRRYRDTLFMQKLVCSSAAIPTQWLTRIGDAKRKLSIMIPSSCPPQTAGSDLVINPSGPHSLVQDTPSPVAVPQRRLLTTTSSHFIHVRLLASRTSAARWLDRRLAASKRPSHDTYLSIHLLTT